MTTRDRALAALYGLAIGDALGCRPRLMSQRRSLDGSAQLTGFESAAADHPLAAGLTRRSITDDTSRPCCWPKRSSTATAASTPADFAAG